MRPCFACTSLQACHDLRLHTASFRELPLVLWQVIISMRPDPACLANFSSSLPTQKIIMYSLHCGPQKLPCCQSCPTAGTPAAQEQRLPRWARSPCCKPLCLPAGLEQT